MPRIDGVGLLLTLGRMRYRIAALVIIVAIACGDPTSAEDNLTLGTSILTLSGSISGVDTIGASAAVIAVFGAQMLFTPINAKDSFHTGGRFDVPLPLPYVVNIDFLGLTELREGTYAIGATHVMLEDS